MSSFHYVIATVLVMTDSSGFIVGDVGPRVVADMHLLFLCVSANPLLINSSMQPDLTVSRTYTSPMCFQDSIDKELMAERSLLDPLPDLKGKG